MLLPNTLVKVLEIYVLHIYIYYTILTHTHTFFAIIFILFRVVLLTHTHFFTPIQLDTGQIRSAIGLAHLLINQRFKQFSSLINDCESGKTPKGSVTLIFLLTFILHFFHPLTYSYLLD